MPGFSLTLLLLPSSSSTAAPPEDVILRLLDASTSAPGWKWTSGAPPSALSPPPAVLASERTTDRAAKVRAQDVQGFARAVERVCNALDKAEPAITRMDTVSGDGDCGLTLQTGARGMRSYTEYLTLAYMSCSYIQLYSLVSARAQSPARTLLVPSSPYPKWRPRRWAAPAVHFTREFPFPHPLRLFVLIENERPAFSFPLSLRLFLLTGLALPLSKTGPAASLQLWDSCTRIRERALRLARSLIRSPRLPMHFLRIRRTCELR